MKPIRIVTTFSNGFAPRPVSDLTTVRPYLPKLCLAFAAGSPDLRRLYPADSELLVHKTGPMFEATNRDFLRHS
jgi:hypothetical protein